MSSSEIPPPLAAYMAPGRLGVATKLRAGVGALLAVTVVICTGLLIFVFQLRSNVNELSNDSLPSIVLFADLERNLDNILYTTVELAEASDRRAQRNLFEEVESYLNAIAAVLEEPVLQTQRAELQALDNVITSSLSSLNEKVLERIAIEEDLRRHQGGMRELRRMAANDLLIPEVNALLADLEEASAIEDRYQLRILSRKVGESYRGLVTDRDLSVLMLRSQGVSPDGGVLNNRSPAAPEDALKLLLAPERGLLSQRDDLLKTNAEVRGLQSEVESIVADFAFVAQARFSRFRQVAADNAIEMQAVSTSVIQLLVASLVISFIVALVVSRSLTVNVSSRLANLRAHILDEAHKVSIQGEDRKDTGIDTGDDEIDAIASSVDVFLSVIGEANDKLRRSLETMEQDVDLAGLMQEAILPRTFPKNPAYAISTNMSAARHVGGDFYQFFELDEHHVSFVIADVSGKGVPAALFMAMSLTVLEAAVKTSYSPAEVLHEVNKRLLQQNPLYYFVTMFYGVIDLRDGSMDFCNAGHNPPILIRKGQAEELPLTGNSMLAVFEEQEFNKHSLTLSPDDTLFLFTDGVTEAFSENVEEFGTHRLLACLELQSESQPDGIVESVTSTVKEFTGEAEQSDDLTMLTFRFNGQSDVRFETGESLIIEIPNELSSIEIVHKRLTDFCCSLGIPDDIQFQTNLCVEEYVVNLIQYGFADDDPHTIFVYATHSDGSLEVEVVDDSDEPFDPLSAPAADLSTNLETREVGGLGIHIIRTYMDHLSYSVTERGNRFTMAKAVPKAA